MKTNLLTATFFIMLSILSSRLAVALEGEHYVHDPATIMESNGKYYTFGTGGNGVVSEDGWTWTSCSR